MSRKLTKKENQIWEILQTEFNPFTEKYPDAWVGWDLGGLDEKENDFAMGICIQPFSFNEKITKQKEKFAEKMLEDELVNECFISFMNKLNNSGLLNKLKLSKTDRFIQLDIWNDDLPHFIDYGIYIGSDKNVLISIELNR
jgi:hypothetical protein